MTRADMSDGPFPPRNVFYPLGCDHRNTLIFLHERNSSGNLLAKSCDEAKSSTGQAIYDHFPATRWVFPTGKMKIARQLDQHDLIDFTNVCEWFNVSPNELEEDPDIEIAELRESVSYILQVIEEEVKLVHGDSKKIFLVGIGQGMALGLVVLLCTHHRVGGFVGVNGWLPFTKRLRTFVDRNDIKGAIGFFRSLLFGTGQQPQQHRDQWPQQTLEATQQPLPLSFPTLPLSQQGTPRSAAVTTLVDNVKEIPVHTQPAVLISHSKGQGLYTEPASGQAAHFLIRKMGFSEAIWMPRSSTKEDKDTVREASDRTCFTLDVPKQLDDIIKFLEESGLRL